MSEVSHAPPFNVATLGQVFTPEHIVEKMIGLAKNRNITWNVLEPSCGNGAFHERLPGCTGIEIDPSHCPEGALCMDFFDFNPDKLFDTIIGNPPFVRFRDISEPTRKKLPLGTFDERTNLYAFFIDRCIDLLRPGGELIFINPRDFLKSTSTARLNRKIMEAGTITYMEDLGDTPIFPGYAPNCVIWRFEKGNMSHETEDGRKTVCHDGQISFLRSAYPHRVADFFDVKVGGVSGADRLFQADHLPYTQAVREFVCSQTVDTGKGRWMIYADDLEQAPAALFQYRDVLQGRKIRKFTDRTWWHWGRKPPVDPRPRIYVNSKTRRKRPFFTHASPWFDGSVLGLMVKDSRLDPSALCTAMNDVDWEELGFVSGGRFLFSQRSLMNARLPASFAKFHEILKKDAA